MLRKLKLSSFFIVLLFLLTACGPSEKEIKELGFSSASEMKEIQAKGFNKKSDFDLSEAKKLGFESIAEMDEAKSKGFNTKEEYVLGNQKKEEAFLSELEQLNAKCSSQYLSKVPADFKLIHCNDESRFFLVSKKKISNDVYEIKYLRDFKKPASLLDGGLSYYAVEEQNCKAKRAKNIITIYSGNMGSGTEKGSRTNDGFSVDTSYAGPRDIYQAACSETLNYQLIK